MFDIYHLEDLSLLINNNDNGKFKLDPDTLISDRFILIENLYARKKFNYLYESDLILSITVEDNIIISKSFFKKEKGVDLYFRENDLPTVIDFDLKGNIVQKSWWRHNSYYRDNYLSPSCVKFKKDIVVFTYCNPNNEKIHISYILYNKKISAIIDCVVKMYNKDLNFKNIEAEFPNFLAATEEDCYDMSTNILTNNVLQLKNILNY